MVFIKYRISPLVSAQANTAKLVPLAIARANTATLVHFRKLSEFDVFKQQKQDYQNRFSQKLKRFGFEKNEQAIQLYQ